ncbi:MAG TPA: hypothetical protein VGC15_21645 [Acetobacteraceae bacterium]
MLFSNGADLERVAVIGPLTCLALSIYRPAFEDLARADPTYLLHSGRHLDGALRTQRVTAVVLETDGTLPVVSGGRVGAGAVDVCGVPAA